ncbi:cell division protein ZapA [Halobacteriovorax sp. HLS]|uniref:cell division protein ZapA n=1 Tax=Halobacteriovorax sp. HLS TaxID=2234000 RepID=UPI000FDAA0A6|nr:cell division protein ZapA [Halobacteriovorax sp. HLS]
MERIREDKEFEVLGYRIKFTPNEEEESVSALETVQFVRALAEQIRQKAPHLDNGQIATLTALQIANEKLSNERDFEANINKLHTTARDALQFIEEVSPSMM